MLRKLLAVLVALGGMTTAQAGWLDMNVSDESVFFQLGTGIGYSLFGPDEAGGTSLYGGLVYNDDNHRAFHMGVQAEGEFRDMPVEMGLGPRLYYVRASSDWDGGAGTLGGQLRFGPDAWGGVGISVSAHFAPKILTVSDIERLRDVDVRLDYRLFPRGTIYLGYRDIRIRDEDRNRGKVDDTFHAGFQVLF